jgi:hypothetical protein
MSDELRRTNFWVSFVLVSFLLIVTNTWEKQLTYSGLWFQKFLHGQESMVEQTHSPKGSQEAKRKKMHILTYFLHFPPCFQLGTNTYKMVLPTVMAGPLCLVNPLWKYLHDTPKSVFAILLGASQSNQVDNPD